MQGRGREGRGRETLPQQGVGAGLGHLAQQGAASGDPGTTAVGTAGQASSGTPAGAPDMSAHVLNFVLG